MPQYAENIRVQVHQVKSAVDAIDHKYRTGRYPNSRWNDGKIIRLCNLISLPMFKRTHLWGCMTQMKIWLQVQEYRAYAREDDTNPPWE